MNSVTRLDYCQFLLSSQINYTLTYFADHTDRFSHDAINRYLRGERLSAQLLWENIRTEVQPSANGYLVFDDTVLDKNSSRKIDLVRSQWSGNEHRVIKGIGVVTCVYINPETDQFWIIDYRIFAPDDDGKTKLDHVHAMLHGVLTAKALPVTTVLMDTWYAERKLLLELEALGLIYYCPMKCNRKVDPSDGHHPYQRMDALTWTDSEHQHGKLIHVKDFPAGHRVRVFRLMLSTERTDYVVTNEPEPLDTEGTQQVCAFRWKIEQVHRETKQLTGIEGCQCRTGRIQRNHIACAFAVWACLKKLARTMECTMYHIKQSLLDDYMWQQLRSPSVKMSLA